MENRNGKEVRTMTEDKLRSRTACLLFGIMAFLSSIFAIQGALLTHVIDEFHPDSYGQGLIASLCSLGGCVAYISALLLIGVPFGNGLIMCIATALSGLLFGAMIPCIMNVACENIPESSLLATSLLMLMLYIGEGVSSPVLGKLEATVGLKWGIVLCAVFMVLTSTVLCVGLRKKKK